MDVEQLLLQLAKRDGTSAVERFDQIPPHWRAEIEHDIECPSCFVRGAEIVSAARSRTSGQRIRQACFRFVSPGHHPDCDFAGTDRQNAIPENLVDLSSEKSELTRAVRRLVCAGIESRAFNQKTIRDMRDWFFRVKQDSHFVVTLDPQFPLWAESIWRTISFWRRDEIDDLKYIGALSTIPGFDWREAAKSVLRRRYEHVYEAIRQERCFADGVMARVSVLAMRYKGQTVFDPTVLQHKYSASESLAHFMARHYLPLRGKSGRLTMEIAPAVLALSALLQFVTEWHMPSAISLFVRLTAQAASADVTLGNVMGLNPFHDFSAWACLKRFQASDMLPPSDFDLKVELTKVEAELRAQYGGA